MKSSVQYIIIYNTVLLFLSGAAKKMTIVQNLFLQEAPYNIEGHYYHFHFPRPVVHEKRKRKKKKRGKRGNQFQSRIVN